MNVHHASKQHGMVFLWAACMAALLLAFPPPAAAMEIGCFCTFLFVSTMFMIGICLTMVTKHLLAKKIWLLSKRRTILITFLEAVLMFAVLFILQTKFYIRVLAYFPLAFALNYALTTMGGTSPAPRRPSKRAVMAALSCMVLPIAVQAMALVATFLSDLITFKELHV